MKIVNRDYNLGSYKLDAVSANFIRGKVKDFNYDETNGMVDSRIWDLGVDSKNNYWLALDGSGVQSFDGKSFVHYVGL